MRVGTYSSIQAVTLVLLLTGCNDDTVTPDPPPPPAATYTVGGTVAGLNGSVTLANNGGDARTVNANGSFAFATPLGGGTAFNVTVTTQPAGQTCTVGGSGGTVGAANVSTVAVTCVTNLFTIGGTVTGLAGSGLVLQNNGADDLAQAADGAFTFATSVASGGAYSVTVLTQPSVPAQTCTPANNAGAVIANVTGVTITCVTNPVVVGQAQIGPAGGTVTGEYGAQIIIPAGALPNTVTIGLTRDSSNSPAFAVSDNDAVGATYELTPHGQAFTLPVTVRIPFEATQVANDAAPTLYKAEQGGAFTALTTTVNGAFLEANITGFSWVMPAAGANKPRMVYVPRNEAGVLSVASLRIDRATGALSAPTSSMVVGEYPTSAVAHPSGRFLYVTHAGSTTVNNIAPNSVAMYRLSTVNGALLGPASAVATTRGIIGFRPTMPVIHPSGKFLYAINFGSASNNGGGDIDRFAINGSTGELTLLTGIVSGNGAQPMGIVFDRTGARAYVLYAGSSSSNPLSSQIAQYDVNLTTGAFTGPVRTTQAGVLGAGQWSIAIDPNGRSLHIVCLSTHEAISYSINATNGALTNLGSVAVLNQPGSIVTDSFGRFAFVGKQTPFYTVNVLSFGMNPTTGTLASAGSALTGCPGGGCVGPIAVVADTQGDLVFGMDRNGGVTSFAVNPASGVLTAVNSVSNAFPPAFGGVAMPFKFAATGVSPVWQNNCTHNCALTGVISSGSGGGAPATNPSPPSTHYLSVSIGAYFGYVTSTPVGIDYGPPTNSNPLGDNAFSAEFTAGDSVELCSAPPPQPAGAYNITWMGSCSGTARCTTVVMDADKFCHANFQPRLP